MSEFSCSAAQAKQKCEDCRDKIGDFQVETKNLEESMSRLRTEKGMPADKCDSLQEVIIRQLARINSLNQDLNNFKMHLNGVDKDYYYKRISILAEGLNHCSVFGTCLYEINAGEATGKLEHAADMENEIEDLMSKMQALLATLNDLYI